MTAIMRMGSTKALLEEEGLLLLLPHLAPAQQASPPTQSLRRNSIASVPSCACWDKCAGVVRVEWVG